MNIFELEAKLKIDTKDYEKALSDAESNSKDFAKSLDDLEDSAKDSFSGVADAANESADDTQSAFSDISVDIDTSNAESSLDEVAVEADSAADDTEGAFAGTYVDVDVSPAVDSLSEVGTAANDAADNVDESFGGGFDSLISSASGMSTSVLGSFSSIVQGIATGGMMEAVQGITEAVSGIAEEAMELQQDFWDAQETIVQGTGAIGDALKDLEDRAAEAWGKIAGDSVTLDESANTVSNLNTRLGVTEEQLGNLDEAFLAYGEAVGTSASGAVNDFVDVLKSWGYSTEDINNNQGVLLGMMDEFTVATQSANISSEELASALSSNSVAAFKDMGYSMDDVIQMITGYVDAGGSASELTSKMSRAYNTLAKDVGGEGAAAAMQEIITAMQSGGDASEILSQSISGTDKTIADLFGSSSQMMIERFQEMTTSADSLSTAFDNQNGKMAETYAAQLNTAEGAETTKNAWTEQYGVLGSVMSGIVELTGGYGMMSAAGLATADTTVSAFDSMAEGADLLKATYNDTADAAERTASGTQSTADATADLAASASDAASSTQESADAVNSYADTMEGRTSEATDSASTDMAEASDAIETETDSAASSVDSNFDSIASDITSAMDTAKTNVSSAVASMRSTLSTTLKGPNIQVPHFSMSGAFDAKTNTVPTVSVSWYSKAMQNAALFNTPTVIGAGEAGNELLTGEQHLQSTVQSAVSSAMNNAMNSVVALLQQYLPICAEGNKTYLNGKLISEEVSRTINKQVNRRAAV